MEEKEKKSPSKMAKELKVNRARRGPRLKTSCGHENMLASFFLG